MLDSSSGRPSSLAQTVVTVSVRICLFDMQDLGRNSKSRLGLFQKHRWRVGGGELKGQRTLEKRLVYEDSCGWSERPELRPALQ